MNSRSLIWKELWQRPTAMLTSLLTITLGVTALVAVQHITVFSEREISGQMGDLGANVLVLPPDTDLEDYYAADMHGRTIPEEYVTRLALARMPGVENLAPKLCVEATVGGRAVTLTGILPRSEFQAKSAWQSAALFTNPVGTDRGCCKPALTPTEGEADPESLAANRTVGELAKDEAILGADLAERIGAGAGDEIELLDESFRVLAVLPATGTVDDGRVFAHLHSVQRLAETGPVVNVIEIMACCEDAAGDLVTNLGETLPNTRIVTIAQVVETQVRVTGVMSKLSWVFFAILLAVGGASIASVMYANVAERRREIGTLMALGATPRFVSRLFLGKALLLGLCGGLVGYLFGTLLATILGPRLVDVAVHPLPTLLVVGLVSATVVAIAASYPPARRASRLDPCLCFGDS